MEVQRIKNLRLCRVDAFENPQFNDGARCLDFGSHYIGWACKPQTRKSTGPMRIAYRFAKMTRLSTNTAEVVKPLRASLLHFNTAPNHLQVSRTHAVLSPAPVLASWEALAR